MTFFTHILSLKKYLTTVFLLFIFINTAHAQDVQKHFMNIPTRGFEENKGQIIGTDAEQVNFIFKENNLSIFLLNDGISYQFIKKLSACNNDVKKTLPYDEKGKSASNDIRTETYRLDIKISGINPNSEISTENKNEEVFHYYNHDLLNIHSFNKVIYHNIYPNIDWVIYEKNGFIKYDFIIHPGGNPKQIKLEAKWADEIVLDDYGNLLLKTTFGTIQEKKPISFQDGKQIATNFILEDGIIGFSIGDYNPDSLLIIDPDIIWSTYYGGNSYDEARCTSIDNMGNVYLSGTTFSTNNIYSGGHQSAISGAQDGFLVKFNASGIRQWATYYGGSATDVIHSCATDTQGNVYIAGNTESASGVAFGGFQNIHGGLSYPDAFLVKFNSNGERQWGTYYGGSQRDVGNSCVTDGSGNVYLAGTTHSDIGIAFGGHQNTFGLLSDGFLVKFNSNGERIWASYYGGENFDAGESCSTDANGNVYLTGYTQSVSGIAVSGHQNNFGGSGDAFVTKFNSNGARIWATYYGGSTIDVGKSSVIDSEGNVFLSGVASSTSNISYNGHQNTYGGGTYDAFLVKLNSNGARQWATYYGGSNYDFCYSSCLDVSGNIYLAGYTKSVTNIAAGGYQNSHGGASFYDAFLVKFNNNGVRQWGTYLGGTNEDMGYSCVADISGNIYLAGITDSNTGISSIGHQNNLGGGNDGYLAKFGDVISAVNNSENNLSIKLYPNPIQSEGILSIQTEMLTKVEINIYNSIGFLVDNKVFQRGNSFQHRINLSAYSSGVYWIEVKTKSGRKRLPLIKR